MTTYLLAVDGGATKTALTLRDDSGVVFHDGGTIKNLNFHFQLLKMKVENKELTKSVQPIKGCPIKPSKCPTNSERRTTNRRKCTTIHEKCPTNEGVSNQSLEVSNETLQVSNELRKASNLSRKASNK